MAEVSAVKVPFLRVISEADKEGFTLIGIQPDMFADFRKDGIQERIFLVTTGPKKGQWYFAGQEPTDDPELVVSQMKDFHEKYVNKEKNEEEWRNTISIKDNAWVKVNPTV